MKKKILSLMLILLLISAVLIMAGCGKDSVNESNTSLEEKSGSEEVVDESEEQDDLTAFINLLNTYGSGVQAFLDEGLSDEDIENVKIELENLDFVQSVEFVSKDEALASAKAENENATILNEIGEENNFYPNSYVISIAITKDNYLEVDEMEDEIMSISGIDTVIFSTYLEVMINAYENNGIEEVNEVLQEVNNALQ